MTIGVPSRKASGSYRILGPSKATSGDDAVVATVDRFPNRAA